MKRSVSNPPLTTPSGLPGNRTPESFVSTNFFSPCSRCKRIVFYPVRPVIYVSALRSLPPLRARFLHYCLLGSWQSKKHAHLARIIRRSSLIQFSIQLGPLDPVRYRGHAPRMDYLALKVS
nr:MAG TPA: hypothetical protein [Caudoviricetes sp.]